MVKLRALREEPDAGQLMTSDQEGKDLAEPEEQQGQEVRRKEILLLVKYFSCLLSGLFLCSLSHVKLYILVLVVALHTKCVGAFNVEFKSVGWHAARPIHPISCSWDCEFVFE